MRHWKRAGLVFETGRHDRPAEYRHRRMRPGVYLYWTLRGCRVPRSMRPLPPTLAPWRPRNGDMSPRDANRYRDAKRRAVDEEIAFCNSQVALTSFAGLAKYRPVATGRTTVGIDYAVIDDPYNGRLPGGWN